MNTATIRLLILNDTRAEAERLISLLHNSGRQVRAQHVDSEEALVKLLQEQTWDLLIGVDGTSNLTPSAAIKQIRRLSRDLPVILQTDSEGTAAIVEGIKLGAVDVVRMDEDQHLLQVITREFDNREQRNERRLAERRLKEIERRNQQLLDSSRDGIAFEQDGMFLYVNDSFADILGYGSRDDLECMPIIDVVVDEQQDEVKAFLKEFTLKNDEIDTANVNWQVSDAKGKLKSLNFEVRKALYDEEICVQLVVKAIAGRANQQMVEQLETIRFQDVVTGLHNKHYLINQLEKAVSNVLQHHHTGALLYIQVEDFLGIVQTRMGVASADIVLGSIAGYLNTQVKPDEILCRFNDDGFMVLLPQATAEEALARAETLAKALRDNIINVDQATLMFHYSVGVGLINETTTGADNPIQHALKALELVHQERRTQKNLLARIYEPVVNKAEAGTGHNPKQMAQMVQKALDQSRFRLLFQPILSLRGSDKEHYEVLVRMLEKDGDAMSPAEFFGVAEQMGAMTKIDRWVILESIKLLADHRNKGHNTRLIINLSAESLKDKTLAPWLAAAFKASKLPTDTVIFQLNELDVNNFINQAKEFTAAVVALGSDCCVNRFGCALNPFNVLAHVSANYVKVDGSFTQELQSGTSEPQALGELVSQLHQLEKITIVPFVENASVLSKLWQSGVHYIQGYYLQGPSENMNFDFDTEN